MINCKRNNQTFEYQLYLGKQAIVDANGWETGETEQAYDEKVQAKANISPATGNVQVESFGNLADYDHVIITHDKTLPIDEHSLIWYEGNRYIVRRIAKSLNCISIAIAKSEVSTNG